MSGICGILNLDGAPVDKPDMLAMTAMLEQRGPDGTNTWKAGFVGLGHTLLASTPESLLERQPFAHPDTGCVITADIRLDNRAELLDRLKRHERAELTSDAELVLLAYLEWGEMCPERLLGDFAFAIWDPSEQALFCARDHSGVRLFYYHIAPGKRFVLASAAKAILVLPQVPYRIDEGRVADFLVEQLQWIDYTSTFFEDVCRLPPGHHLTVAQGRLDITEYWRPQPGPELGSLSNKEYGEGLLEVLTRSVEARLRSPQGETGSMMSGGMDSGSVVAVAKEILANSGRGPLPTYSGAQPKGTDCAESRAVHAAAGMSHISPTIVQSDDLQDSFEIYLSGLDEPFDGEFTILYAMYKRAQRDGRRVLLDGAGGDVVLSEGSYIVRLLRRGEPALALREIRGFQKFCGADFSLASTIPYLRAALVPEILKKPLRPLRYRASDRDALRASLISPDFARAVNIEARFAQYRETNPAGWIADYASEYCNKIRPSMTAGRERYARLASASGIEASDPFLDRRVIAYCSRLPGQLLLRDGWPKIVLRDIMAERLPDEVRWCTGKPHLGWLFNDAIAKAAVSRDYLGLADLHRQLRGYVDIARLESAWHDFKGGGDSAAVHSAMVLATWLRENETRPVVATVRFR